MVAPIKLHLNNRGDSESFRLNRPYFTVKFIKGNLFFSESATEKNVINVINSSQC